MDYSKKSRKVNDLNTNNFTARRHLIASRANKLT